MKNHRIISLILFVIVLLISCKTTQPARHAETRSHQLSNEFISGKVNEIKAGKDGYTAQITTSGNIVYFATISRTNLKNADQYKTVSIGDTITVKGDIWKMESETHITVREMR